MSGLDYRARRSLERVLSCKRRAGTLESHVPVNTSIQGSAGGRARATRLSAEQRSAVASLAAQARWRGGQLSAGQAERLARAILASWVARADLDIARPSREDIQVDEIVTPSDLAWAAPLQVKGVARDGLTVHKKYVGLPLLVCYVLIGRDDGGLEQRSDTCLVLLEPSTAWQLPTDLGMLRDIDADLTYRWPVIGKRLASALEDFTARDPRVLADMLTQLAPLRRQL
jgi:hypothetical protein